MTLVNVLFCFTGLVAATHRQQRMDASCGYCCRVKSELAACLQWIASESRPLSLLNATYFWKKLKSAADP